MTGASSGGDPDYNLCGRKSTDLGGEEMFENVDIEYILRGLADGFRMADKEESKPDIAAEFVSLEKLAELVGRETLDHLADLKWEDKLIPIFTLQGGGMKLSVAVADWGVVGLMRTSVLPSPRQLARYSVGLAEFIVLAGQSALVKFRQEMDGEILRKAIEFGAWLFPYATSNVGGMWCVLTWLKEPPFRGA
jgi:hypothetical protein